MPAAKQIFAHPPRPKSQAVLFSLLLYGYCWPSRYCHLLFVMLLYIHLIYSTPSLCAQFVFDFDFDFLTCAQFVKIQIVIFCEAMFSSYLTQLPIPIFTASTVITMAVIHLVLYCLNRNGGRERKRRSRYGLFSCWLTYAAIPSNFAASIVIIMTAIHLLLCCFNCNGRTETKSYDVFLSFRGPDVRRGFVDHLYHALTHSGFRVFLDTHHLVRGREISASLQHAIEASRILIPIFSTNYAESAWCLREVALIARQVQENGKTKKGSAIAVPLFYNVTPSQVRHPDQSHGSPFAESFEEHESSGKYSAHEIEEWKAALFTLSNLAGWSLQEDSNGYEAAMVKRVVKCLANTLGETNHHQISA